MLTRIEEIVWQWTGNNISSISFSDNDEKIPEDICCVCDDSFYSA